MAHVTDLEGQQIRYGNGFFVALDQRGGPTPGALKLYGILRSAYANDVAR